MNDEAAVPLGHAQLSLGKVHHLLALDRQLVFAEPQRRASDPEAGACSTCGEAGSLGEVAWPSGLEPAQASEKRAASESVRRIG